MGVFLSFYSTKRIRKEYIIAFFFSFLFGLMVHLFKLTNYLPNHDSMYNFYSDQNMIASGRWFLSIVCGFSSFFDLPWINGLFALFFISLTSVFFVKIFQVNKPIVICIISALMVTFPAITESFCFEFTADGYMFAMLLASLAAYFQIRQGRSFFQIAVSSLLLCFSCGIYQAYISFYIVLIICWYIWIVFTEDFSNKVYLRYIVNGFISLVLGLLLYYCIWKVCMFFQGVTPTDYQGIDNLQFLIFSNPLLVIKNAVIALITFVFEKNVFKYGITPYAIFNCIFIFSSLFIFFISCKKAKIIKNRFKLISVIMCILLLPSSICFWQMVSASVFYSYRMLQSIFVLYGFAIVLCDRYVNNAFSNVFVILVSGMIINLSVLANIAYNYLNYEYECSYAEANRLVYAIEEFKREHKEVSKVALVGNREKEVALDQNSEANGAFIFTNMIEKSLLLDSVHTENFLKNVLYYDADFADYNERQIIENSREYAQMESWFDGGSIEIINNIITIKL